MVAGMEPPSTSSGYHVWLMAGQDKVWAGQIEIDDRGWGTVSLILPESIMVFEKVELTEADSPNTSAPPTDMVLVGDLVSMNAPYRPRMLNCAPIGQFYR